MVALGILNLDHPHAGGNHLPALAYLTDRVRVAAIYHEDEAAARPWLERLGAAYYPSRDALLADPSIQAVLVTSQNFRHAEDCIAAAQAGKDILCDKPIATSAQDARRIRDAVEKAGVRFLTTYPVRFNTSVQRVKRLIDQGALGEIKAVMATNHGCMYEPGAPDWVKQNALNGGCCIVDHTVHVADIIRWLTGSEFATVAAQASRRLHDDIEGEDIGVLQGKLTSGALYQIDTSWTRLAEHPMWGDVTFRIVGRKASASLDIYNNQRIELHVEGVPGALYANNIVLEHGEIFLDYWRWAQQGIEPMGANAVDGLRSVELVYAAYESLKENRPVQVLRG